MRTHGWGGSPPADDQEARARLLAAARGDLAAGHAPTLASVAQRAQVTRQTVYRYFPSTQSLLVAAGSDAADGLLDLVGVRISRLAEARTAVVEATALLVEALPDDPHLAVLRGTSSLSSAFASPLAVTAAVALLHRTAVAWPAHGYDDERLQQLAAHLLRTVHGLLEVPLDRPSQGAELRDFLRRWLAPVV